MKKRYAEKERSMMIEMRQNDQHSYKQYYSNYYRNQSDDLDQAKKLKRIIYRQG